jgi:hypothetical protein
VRSGDYHCSSWVKRRSAWRNGMSEYLAQDGALSIWFSLLGSNVVGEGGRCQQQGISLTLLPEGASDASFRPPPAERRGGGGGGAEAERWSKLSTGSLGQIILKLGVDEIYM